jgi:TRAP-type uncharacterized transport system fused permease subunit
LFRGDAAASAIADENTLVIALHSVKIAIGAFLVPFAFISNQALLLKGSVLEIAIATANALVGLFLPFTTPSGSVFGIQDMLERPPGVQ